MQGWDKDETSQRTVWFSASKCGKADMFATADSSKDQQKDCRPQGQW